MPILPYGAGPLPTSAALARAGEAAWFDSGSVRPGEVPLSGSDMLFSNAVNTRCSDSVRRIGRGPDAAAAARYAAAVSLA